MTTAGSAPGPMLPGDPEAVRAFAGAVAALRPDAVVTVDRPMRPEWEWWIDARLADRVETASWSPEHGYGLYAPDAGFGEAPGVRTHDLEEAVRRFREGLA